MLMFSFKRGGGGNLGNSGGPKKNIEIFVRSSFVEISIAIIIILILFLLTGYTRGVMYGKIDCM